MDFEAAILSHTRWKRRLHHSMAGGDRLDAPTVAAPDRCDLGRWLLQEQSRFGDQPDFRALLDEHTAFHRAAGRVVQEINAGAHDEASRLLGFDSEFAQHSARVVELLQRLQRRDSHA